ncbi:metallophosphoesterase [Methylococcus sp. EFPC2]|uniref:metallophosphoesterase n=1 Tax=Methylococcus sp. EFPC2 TaxID=2812648 RepID=UPI001968892F|nr:metallophosphoesterase [Methylococcus sp. EFPC2]QSA98742.1 metallophosphoesterase [Methylococcus sp. EFPC2]
MSKMNRRDFMKNTGALAVAGSLPVSLIELAFADAKENFTLAYISDSHIQHIKGSEFVRNWDRGLIRAVAETNLLTPKPDFIVYGGDLAQLGTKAELDHGAEILSSLKGKVHHVMGEHDYYLDLGAYWEKLFGPQHYSFDHKGVHFVVLNSILTHDEWTFHRWPTPEQRMAEMAGLDNPNGSPFMVGEKQRAWLKDDLAKVDRKTPVVVFSHSPLQKIYKGWNFWTEDADEVQALLKPFEKVTVIYGHVHQIQYNQIGNISFNSVMATAWPWPYPTAYKQAEVYLPKLTVPINRADPFHERDATGWQFINLASGNADLHYTLYDNQRRVVAYNTQTRQPEDTQYQAPERRIPPQNHY